MNRTLRLIIVGVVLVVIIVLAWFLLISPLRSDIDAVEASIETERAKLSAAQAQLAQAEAIREEGEKNRGMLLELAKMVPEGEQIPSLLLQIQDLADQSGIAFIAITPGDPIQSGDFDIIPLELEFTGTYFDLSDFVYRAEQMVAGPGRLLAVKNLDLQLSQDAGATGSGADVSPLLAVNMTLYAFEMAAATEGTATTTTSGDSSTTTDETGSGETTTSTTTGSGETTTSTTTGS
jgi:type IV pilus assembly protein PilO